MIDKRNRNTFILLLALLVAISCSACSTPPAGPVSSSGNRFRTYDRFFSSNRNKKYTKADYDLALSFQTDSYKDMTVDDFNRKVLNWEDEDDYHKNEDALDRLFCSLPDDDANADFFFTTLSYTWKECRTKHYNLCEREGNPSYSGSVQRETLGDIFGDSVVLTGAYADFWFDYNISDGSALTIGQRDSILQSTDADMQKFLDQQAEKALKDEDAMEKSLLAELKRILGKLNSGLTCAAKCDVSYSWDSCFDDGDDDQTSVVESASQRNDIYTKEQYDLLIRSLQFSGYEDTSIAEFDRNLNAAFHEGDSDDLENLHFAYEMVSMYLPESDPNAVFLQMTVPQSWEEYNAKEDEVYSGKTADPEFDGHSSAYREEDVFGDKVRTVSAEAEYAFTYRLLRPDTLTVRERNEFLIRVTENVQNFLKSKLDSGNVSESDFETGLENAGKAASNDKIMFTGYKIDYFDCDSYH